MQPNLNMRFITEEDFFQHFLPQDARGMLAGPILSLLGVGISDEGFLGSNMETHFSTQMKLALSGIASFNSEVIMNEGVFA